MIKERIAISKARIWNGILYPDNMREDWRDCMEDCLQVPFAYCVHDKDLDNDGDERVVHIHVMIVFSNTTTHAHAKDVLNLLSALGKECCHTVEAAISAKKSFDYLIHDTDNCRKQCKYQYSAEDRQLGNGFDIGFYEQLTTQDRVQLVRSLCDFIIVERFVNFVDFYIAAACFYDDDWRYSQVIQSYSGLFERLTKSNYLKYVLVDQHGGQAPSQGQAVEKPSLVCPHCGCRHVIKRGFNKSGSRAFCCKSCGKRFTL